jgi:hypothetical protein
MFSLQIFFRPVSVFVAFIAIYASCTSRQTDLSITMPGDSVTISGELTKLFDLSLLSLYETTAQSYQISSFDSIGGNNDGFNGTYSFLRRNPDSTLVIFNAEGPGVIHRIWTPTPTEDTLDFYIDDPEKISFSIRYIDLFSGQVHPFIAPLCGNELGGYYCYFPIPYQKSCRIICRGKKLQFHQIQYKRYPAATSVKSFSLPLSSEESAGLETVKTRWGSNNLTISGDYPANSIQSVSGTFTISPGESKTFFERNKGGRIVGMELKPTEAFGDLHKQLDLQIRWDDDEKPAVDMPVADFFGYAFGDPSMRSYPVGSRGKTNYCYFPMPFDSKAHMSLTYREMDTLQTPCQIEYTIFYSEIPRNPVLEGKFYAEWHRDINPPAGQPHYFLEKHGKGHLVGTILQAQGLKAGMTLFFEGDDSTVVDGQNIIHGTGSEDYFNGGWYAFLDRWDTKMSLPLHGSLDYSLAMSRTGGYRIYLTDKIPFNSHIVHTIEHGPVGNTFPVDYTSVSFYYSDSADYGDFQSPTNKLSAVYIPDTLFLYPQLMSYGIWDKINFESGWHYNTGGMSFIYTITDESRLQVSLRDIPHGIYKVFADIRKFNEGCSFSIWHRQNQMAPWTDTFSSSDERVESLYLCDMVASDFQNTMTFRFKSNGLQNKFFLNRVMLVKKAP